MTFKTFEEFEKASDRELRVAAKEQFENAKKVHSYTQARSELEAFTTFVEHQTGKA